MNVLNIAEKELLKHSETFGSPGEMLEWLLDKGIVDFKRCRTWAVRRFYFDLVKKGEKKMDAITATSIKFCIAEETVQKAIYYCRDL